MSTTDLYPKLGQRLKARYEVQDVVNGGVGATAVVLKCRDLASKQLVAVKRFFPDRMSRQLHARIYEEVSLPVQSAYVVKAYECFEDEGFSHSVMPFIEGENLRDKLDLHQRAPERVAAYTATCFAKAAEDLHAIGVLSTDIKLDNGMELSDGRVVLVDLVCFERIGRKAQLSMGTVPYAAPELLRQEVLYPNTDLYSIGVVLFEMLVGTEKFNQLSSQWELHNRRGLKVDVSAIRNVYPRAYCIIDRAIEPNPKDRYQSATELMKELLPYYHSLTPQYHALLLRCGTGRELKISSGRMVIGRNHIDQNNPFISESHCEIDVQSLAVRDLGSSNGTRINGTRIMPNTWIPFKEGDTIQLANVLFSVRFS